AALAIFSLSLIAQSTSQVLIRAFYAMGKTKYPFLCAIGSVGITLLMLIGLLIPDFLNTNFIYSLEALLKVDIVESSLILILPIAFTFGQWAQLVLLLLGIGGLRIIFSRLFFTSIFQSGIGALIIALLAYMSFDFLIGIFFLTTFLGIAFQGVIAGT